MLAGPPGEGCSWNTDSPSGVALAETTNGITVMAHRWDSTTQKRLACKRMRRQESEASERTALKHTPPWRRRARGHHGAHRWAGPLQGRWPLSARRCRPHRSGPSLSHRPEGAPQTARGRPGRGRDAGRGPEREEGAEPRQRRGEAAAERGPGTAEARRAEGAEPDAQPGGGTSSETSGARSSARTRSGTRKAATAAKQRDERRRSPKQREARSGARSGTRGASERKRPDARQRPQVTQGKERTQ